MSELREAIPVLAAVDVPAAVAFWVDTLGFTRDFEVEGFAGVSRDGVHLYISATPDQLVPDNTMAWLVAGDLDALHAGWAGKVPPETPDHPTPAMTAPAQTPWDTYEFAIRDPAGNCVHFVQAPKST